MDKTNSYVILMISIVVIVGAIVVLMPNSNVQFGESSEYVGMAPGGIGSFKGFDDCISSAAKKFADKNPRATEAQSKSAYSAAFKDCQKKYKVRFSENQFKGAWDAVINQAKTKASIHDCLQTELNKLKGKRMSDAEISAARRAAFEKCVPKGYEPSILEKEDIFYAYGFNILDYVKKKAEDSSSSTVPGTFVPPIGVTPAVDCNKLLEEYLAGSAGNMRDLMKKALSSYTKEEWVRLVGIDVDQDFPNRQDMKDCIPNWFVIFADEVADTAVPLTPSSLEGPCAQAWSSFNLAHPDVAKEMQMNSKTMEGYSWVQWYKSVVQQNYPEFFAALDPCLQQIFYYLRSQP